MFIYAKYKGFDITQGGMLIREFNDYEEISDYALSAMTWAVNTGIIYGNNENYLKPKSNANPKETATILHRFLEVNK